jgi:hypothetical protein
MVWVNRRILAVLPLKIVHLKGFELAWEVAQVRGLLRVCT